MSMLAPQFTTRMRILVAAFFVFVLFSAIGIRLWQLQISGGSYSLERVSRQYIRNMRIPAVRGRIFTSDGELVAGNRASYDVVFHISEMRKPGARRNTVRHILSQINTVAKTIGRENKLTEGEIMERITTSPGLPFSVFTDLNRTELAKAIELSPFIPGMDIAPDILRIYPHGSFASHILGYARKGDPQDSDDWKYFSYAYQPDIVGKAGLEQLYDEWLPDRQTPVDPTAPDVQADTAGQPLLRGVAGKRLVMVDALEFIRKPIGDTISPENGKDIVLTLDFRAQKIAESLIQDKTGAIIVLDAGTGNILAMASSPTYPPSIFIPRITSANYKALLADPGKPLLNKATQGVYSPGSIVKPLMSLAILEDGVSPEDTVECVGYTKIGASRIHCWIFPHTGGGHGPMTLLEAVTVSCNDFFIKSGLKLGVDRISAMFASAGMGRKTGFALPEASGNLPKRESKTNWNAFDTALISIGHGEVLVSPLQVAVYTAAIANGGRLMRPQILKNIIDGEETIFTQKPEVMGNLAATPEHIQFVRDAMYNAVYAENGGAKRGKTDAIELCGKTGTAEVGPRGRRHKNTWFIGFGTDEASETTYAITVFVEGGISGGRSAAPLASEFFTRFLQ